MTWDGVRGSLATAAAKAACGEENGIYVRLHGGKASVGSKEEASYLYSKCTGWPWERWHAFALKELATV